MSSRARLCSCALLALACNVELSAANEGGAGTAPEARPVDRAGTLPPPITGGTLMVTTDGAFAIAVDPDRDVVHVVELAKLRETATIALAPGARPFRAAEDADGRVHLTLRGTGELATIDPVAGRLLATTHVCPNPRGVAHDEARDAILVACAGGQLVELAAADRRVLQRRWLAPDLRDVFVDRGTTYVSRFRAAEVLEVLPERTSQDAAPIAPTVGGILRTPGTAWRTVPRAKGGWLMLHQLASTAPLPAPAPGTAGSFFDSGETGYGGSGPGNPCTGASSPGLTAVLDDGTLLGSGPIAGIALAVDVAIAPDGWQVAVASPSQHRAQHEETQAVSLTTYAIVDFADPGECRPPSPPLAVDDFVAVAYAPDGSLLALTREAPDLYVFPQGGGKEIVPLAGEEILDTGHELFHLDTRSGIACASCHPEGGDDGRVWAFVDQGPRRTQALDVGIAGTAPFHWRGDMVDLETLVHEVRERRMGGARLTRDHVVALAEWMIAIPPQNPERDASDATVAAGAVLFDQHGCRTCHAGDALTSNAPADLGRGALQIPNLHGIATRPPYMHDGRCTTLRCATEDMLASTRPELPADDEVDAIVAYLESL